MFGKGKNFDGKQLDEVVGALLKELKRANTAFDDLKSFYSPVECRKLIGLGFNGRIHHILHTANIEADDLLAEIKKRGVSDRWIYFSGLTHMVEPFLH